MLGCSPYLIEDRHLHLNSGPLGARGSSLPSIQYACFFEFFIIHRKENYLISPYYYVDLDLFFLLDWQGISEHTKENCDNRPWEEENLCHSERRHARCWYIFTVFFLLIWIYFVPNLHWIFWSTIWMWYAVVWNPWDKKAKSLPDLGDEDYKKMLCVDSAAVETPIVLKPSEEWKGRQELSTVSSSYCSGQLDPRKVLYGLAWSHPWCD